MITRRAETLFSKSKAFYSDCECYRYRLDREWNSGTGHLVFVMLNPSTATEEKNDPTVHRCQRRAVFLGYTKFTVLNLFAWRATDPNELLQIEDPVGPENDSVLAEVARKADAVICAWGNHKAIGDRARDVLKRFGRRGIEPLALKINGDGSPAHPLYLAYSLRPKPFILPR